MLPDRIAEVVTRGWTRKVFLCDASRIDVWEKWRTQQSVALYQAIRAELDRIDPRVKFYVSVSTKPTPEQEVVYESLKKIDHLFLVPMRWFTDHRHRLHWGSPMDDGNERLYDPALARNLMNGNLGFVDSYPSYFESFNGTRVR